MRRCCVVECANEQPFGCASPGVVREGDAATGKNRDAAGVRHFFDYQHLRSGVVLRDRSNPACGAETDDDDVYFFVPGVRVGCHSKNSFAIVGSAAGFLRLYGED